MDNISLTLAIITGIIFVLIIGLGFLVYYKNKPKLPAFLKYAIGFLTGYSVAIGLSLFIVNWTISQTMDSLDTNPFFYIVIFILLLIGFSIGGIFVSNFKRTFLKIYSLISLCILSVYTIVFLIIFPTDAGYTNFETTTLIISVVFFALILFLIPLLFGKKTENENNTKATVYAAISIALGFSLSYLKFYSLSNGGSITFASLLPLIVYSYMFGTRKGAIAGVIYGMLQFIQEPYFLHPFQFILEYPLAFGFIGLAGIIRELKILSKHPFFEILTGGLIVCTMRFICHFIAGIIIWKDPSLDTMAQISVSLVYNISYVVPDTLIALVMGGVLMTSKSFKSFLK